jgi:arabinofuranosyltransferase
MVFPDRRTEAARSEERGAPVLAVLPRGLAWIWSGLVAGGLFWFFRTHGYDDPYITYRYASNLAHAAGFVYNAGERVLSTTTPLYTLILAVIGLAGIDIPIASNLIGCLSLALGGLAFWYLGEVAQSRAAGTVALLLYPLFPLLIGTIGAETALYNALILFGFLAYAREHNIQAAALLALATLVRADGLLAAVPIAVDLLLVRRRPLPWCAMLVYAALLAPWFLFAWVYFGAPLPVTLAAKQRQGLMAISEPFFAGLLRQARDDYWHYPIYRGHFVVAAFGLFYGLVRQHLWLLILGWSLLHVAAYSALGVTSYFWYYGPVVPGFVALIGLGVQALHQFVARFAGRRWAAGAAGLLALALLFAQNGGVRYFIQHRDDRLPSYQAAGEWLRAHTSPDASVGALEVGVLGYYAQRRMIDFAGLLQPQVALRLTPDTTYDDAAIWAIQHFQPDYIVFRPDTLPRLAQDSSLRKHCRLVHALSAPAYAIPLEIYACRRT